MFWSVVAGILTLGMIVIAAAVAICVKKCPKEPADPADAVAATPPTAGPAAGTRSKKGKKVE